MAFKGFAGIKASYSRSPIKHYANVSP